jgi:hypothetical protein
MESKSNTNDCENCIKIPSLPLSSLDKQVSMPQTPVMGVENICNTIDTSPDLIIFRDFGYNKIYPKPVIVLNKNLDILRTVILLN